MFDEENQVNIIKGNAESISVVIEKELDEELKKYDKARHENTLKYIISYLTEFKPNELVQIHKSFKNKYLSLEDRKSMIILYCVGLDSEVEANITIRTRPFEISQEVTIEYLNNNQVLPESDNEYLCNNYLHYFIYSPKEKAKTLTLR